MAVEDNGYLLDRRPGWFLVKIHATDVVYVALSEEVRNQKQRGQLGSF